MDATFKIKDLTFSLENSTLQFAFDESRMRRHQIVLLTIVALLNFDQILAQSAGTVVLSDGRIRLLKRR